MIVRVPPIEWDMSNSQRLVETLAGAYDPSMVIVDLTDVGFMDSACLSKLAMLQKQRAARGLPPASFVVNVPSLRRLFQILGYDTRWQLFETVEAAANP